MSRVRRAASAGVVAVTALAGGVVAAAPAQAEAPRVACSNIPNGELCVHVWGSVGAEGTVAVSYRKAAGAKIWGNLYWEEGDRYQFLWNGDMSAGSTYAGHSKSVHGAGDCYHGHLYADVGGHFDTPKVCF